ncbi:MAG: ABC transporter permease [Gammaproteobacteria bacterium]|nr:ABC transporter permease [Gammaproteobacteria bacterium]NIR84990.1 ABC transporter permease [Gammaproteobacteria bacterium]NIR88257.1 ABC transporter permease [Gammaproteobacteria bacterium]NIU06037.1 ABC transporter permease [Gammaproteobacteria bacterium]NIV73456.1 ABC transporter permease subunit [Gammaproteobacteria bacterium]
MQRWAFYVPLVFMVVFFVVPMLLTVVWSFFERTLFWMEPGFTLASYIDFFASARFENFLWSIFHSFNSVAASFLIGFPIAVFVRRHVPRIAQHRVILLFILPFMVSEAIRTFMLRPVLGRNGLVNSVLMDLGLISEPITAILFTPLGVIIGEILSFLPFMVFACFLAMEAVPKYIFEVCQDLGAGRWNTFRDVIVPLAAPGIFAGGVFILVNGLGVALIPNILGGPGAVNAGLIATQAIIALDFPLAMAVSAIMMATLLGLLYLGHRLFDLTRILEPIA